MKHDCQEAYQAKVSSRVALPAAATKNSLPTLPTLVEEGALPTQIPLGLKLNPTKGTLITITPKEQKRTLGTQRNQ